MEMARDEVRVMTVHGAKGLEANTVILADTTTPPGGPRDPRLLTLDNGALVWATARANDVDAMSDARAPAQQEARDEYRRLLYVAMTRAAERLVICGTQGTNKIPDGCWYQLVENALHDNCVSEAGRRRRRQSAALSQGQSNRRQRFRRTSCRRRSSPLLYHRGSRTNATSGTSAPRTITPSSVMDDDAARPFTAAANAQALLRGTLVHRLMQSLPDIPAARRAKAAEEYSRQSRQRIRPRTTPRRSPNRCCSCSTMRSSPRCSCPAAGPKCRSLGVGRNRRRNSARVRPGRPPGGDANLCADCAISKPTGRRRAESRRCHNLTSASSRSTAPCS